MLCAAAMDFDAKILCLFRGDRDVTIKHLHELSFRQGDQHPVVERIKKGSEPKEVGM